MSTGIFTLGDPAITASATYITDWITGFDGVREIGVDLMFVYGGSGGTSGKVFLQTSLRQATSTLDAGIDLLCMTFLLVSKARLTNLETGPAAAFLTPTDGTLADDTILNSGTVVLGDRFRLKIITQGVYGGQSLVSGRIAAR